MNRLSLQDRRTAHHACDRLTGNWRLTFTFEGSDAVLVDYHDYH